MHATKDGSPTVGWPRLYDPLLRTQRLAILLTLPVGGYLSFLQWQRAQSMNEYWKLAATEFPMAWHIQYLPFFLSLFGLLLPCWMLVSLPLRKVNVLLLRAFELDETDLDLRRRILNSLSRGMRMSGIRRPSLRFPVLLQGLLEWAYVFRYLSPKHFNLESGDDWRSRLAASLNDARCVVIDLRTKTPSVDREIELCIPAVRCERILFVTGVGHAAVSRRYIQQVAGLTAVEANLVRIAEYGTARHDSEAFEADIAKFIKNLPAGTQRVLRIPADLAAPDRINDLWRCIGFTLGVLLAGAFSIALARLLLASRYDMPPALVFLGSMLLWWLVGRQVRFAYRDAVGVSERLRLMLPPLIALGIALAYIWYSSLVIPNLLNGFVDMWEGLFKTAPRL